MVARRCELEYDVSNVVVFQTLYHNTKELIKVGQKKFYILSFTWKGFRKHICLNFNDIRVVAQLEFYLKRDYDF